MAISEQTAKRPLSQLFGPVSWSGLWGDVCGGAMGALIVIPIILSCGLVSYQSIGPAYAAAGVAAAFVTAVLCAVVAGLFGGATLHVNSPKTSHAAILSGFIAVVATHHSFSDVYPPDRAPAALMTVCFLTILVSGVVQFALGASRLGAVVKFIPHPVLAGFINGFALQIMLGQVPKVVGLDTEAQLWPALAGHLPIRPWALALAIGTAVLMQTTKRLAKGVPPALVGLAGGTLAYLLASQTVDPSQLGPVIGALPEGVQLLPRFADMAEFMGTTAFSRHLFLILATGVTLAMVSSIQSLLSAAGADRLQGTRHDSNRELLVQGVGNILAAVFGGTPSGGAPNITQAVHANGGRTRLANLTHAAVLVGLASGLGQVIAMIPMSVMAAVVITTTAGAMDKWTQQLVRRIGSSSALSRVDIGLNLAVVVLVTALVVTAGALPALGAGMALTFLVFLYRSNVMAVRRVLRSDRLRSRTSRPGAADALLDGHGGRIVVIEVEGPLFFGSAETVVKRVETEMQSADWVILDCRRVGHIDSSGAMALKRLDDTMAKLRKRLFLSHLPAGGNRRRFLLSVGFDKPEKEGRVFEDTDSALNQAEDDLLAQLGGLTPAALEIAPRDFDLLRGLSREDVALLVAPMIRRTYAAGEVILRQGDDASGLFLLSRGRVSVRTEAAGRPVCLQCHEPGITFGEMALLSRQRRVATVQADTSVVVHELPGEAFERLLADRPATAVRVMRNLAIGLTQRLNSQTQTILHLEA